MVRIDGIEIHGRPRFEYRTRQALEVLSDSQTFVSVKGYLTAIREARSSGLAAIWGTTTFQVGPRTWQAPVVWYASAIVHDAGHAQLYRENRHRFLGFFYTPTRAWTGVEAERLCLRLQLAALRDLDASQEVLRYVGSSIRRIKTSGFGPGDESVRSGGTRRCTRRRRMLRCTRAGWSCGWSRPKATGRLPGAGMLVIGLTT